MTPKKARAEKKVQEIQQALATHGEHIGDIIWWALPDSATKADEFRARWEGGGLSTDYLPETPTAYRALVDAATAAIRGNKAYKYVGAGNENGQHILALLRVDVVSPGNVEAPQEARVAVDEKTGQFFTDDPDHEVVKAIRAKYDALYGVFQSRDIRDAIVNVIKACAGVTLRETGGVYWVPRTSANTMRTLDKVIEGGGDATFSIIPVHESSMPGGNMDIGIAAKGSIEAELASLKKELDGFAKRSDVRASTVAARIEMFQALRAKADLYHSILAVEVDDLAVQMEALEATAAEMVAAIEEKQEVEA